MQHIFILFLFFSLENFRIARFFNTKSKEKGQTTKLSAKKQVQLAEKISLN
jgi:hypothetical protein